MDYEKFRLRSFTNLEPIYVLECGSYYELPQKYCRANPTNPDLISYSYDICAIPWNRNSPKNTKCTVLRIDSKQTPPGFVRLMVDRNNTEDNPTYFRRPRELGDIRAKTGDPSWLLEPKLKHKGQAVIKTNRNLMPSDLVYVVYCPYWPVEAEEWRKRKRFHGWPNEKLIARITRGGCHFVSKLRTWSSSDDTEWRFSFSKAELLLIHSWTPDQKFAYHCIRVIRNTFSKLSKPRRGDGNKGLQTYYFKTLMFWACEEFPPEFWGKQNIHTWIKTMFRRFLRCLEDKYCPSYFIPECNIMSHLKDEGNFDKVLQMVQNLVTGKSDIIEIDNSKTEYVMSERSFEHQCTYAIARTFPLSEKLNGRFAQYLSDCEWFSPEMKNLHAAIEAHLRLMSVDSVTERRTSKDYVVCVENFNLSLSKREEFESYECLNGDMSILESWIRIFVRKHYRNCVTVYRRMNLKDYAHDKIVHSIAESYPSLLQSVTSACRANFYFTAMKSYKECLIECEKCFEVFHKISEVRYLDSGALDRGSYIPILICNRLSQIFDEHLQVILGFATLHRNISFSNSPIIIATSHEVCLKVEAWKFLEYLRIRCKQKLYSKLKLTDSSFSVSFLRPYMSQLMDNADFSAAILLAALRQSREYKNCGCCVCL